MLFNSLQYLVFLPSVFALYFLISPRYRWAVLLIASYVFYAAWRVDYIVLILLSTVVDYVAARRMSVLEDQRSRRRYLYLSIFTNLSILCFFKYSN
ncbi:MAG: MBOAT family protein, partial [Verrucomicrobiota bacterium]